MEAFICIALGTSVVLLVHIAETLLTIKKILAGRDEE